MALTDSLYMYANLDEPNSGDDAVLDYGPTLVHPLRDVYSNVGPDATGGPDGGACRFCNAPLATREYFDTINEAATKYRFSGLDWSVAIWAKLADETHNRHLVTRYNVSNTAQQEFRFFFNTTQKKWVLGVRKDGANIDYLLHSQTPIVTATWYFLAFGYDHTNDKLWVSIDGGAAEELAGSAGMQDVALVNLMTIGADYAGADTLTTFNGRIAKLGMWTKRLTAADITNLYNGGNGLNYPFTEYPAPADVTQTFQRVFDLSNAKILVSPVSASSTGSLLSIRQILDDCWNVYGQTLRVVDVSAATNTDLDKLSPTQIFQKVHDPGAHALRVIQGVAAGGSGSILSKEQILWKCYDPTNVALRCSPAGAGGTGGGSKLDLTQILREIYDPGVGLRMNL